MFGAGYNGAVNPNIGAAVFVLDLEDEGRLLKVIDIESEKAQVIQTWRTFIGSSHRFLLNNRTELDISRLFPNLTFDVSKGESEKIETTNSLQPILTFSGTGNVKTVTKASFPTWRPGYVIISKMKVDIANSLPADLSVITADGTNKANYDGAIIYASDLEGKITKINLTENFVIDNDANSVTYKMMLRNNSSNKQIQTTTLFDSETTSSNGRYIYTRPEVTINNDSNLWLYFGTGNTQKLQEQSNQVQNRLCLLYTSPSPRDATLSRMPSSA